eukprot:TRINITY_DN107063_c0_g1_i1.p1 TRINITY_DN107063_c0_g1~~TRINITY_DN107063_c0_g1_i1.p1  ORF type:complete len:480 (+),score=78.01 TRINITY_DN107063_c0_g1_i1:47-1441(+)
MTDPSESADHEATLPDPVNATLDAIGFGRFQVMMILICGLAWFVDSVEAGGLAYIYVTLDSEWGTTTASWGLLTSVKYASSVVGALLFGTVADRSGRQPAFLAALLVTAVAGLASAAAGSFYVLLTCRAVTNLGAGGLLPVAISLLAEHMPTTYRDSFIVCMHIFFTSGHVLAVVISMLIPNGPGMWRVFVLSMALPSMLLLLCWKLIPESPAFLHMSGQHEKAREHLHRICQMNRCPEGALEAYIAKEERPGPDSVGRGLSYLLGSKHRVVQVFLFGFLWAFAMAASDYTTFITEIGHKHGFSKHSVELFMIVCKVLGVCVYIVAALCARGGRGPIVFRLALAGSTLAAALASAVISVQGPKWLLAMSAMLLFLPYEMVWALIYALTASAFAPEGRASALSTCTAFSRGAATITPLITGTLQVNHESWACYFWAGAWACAAIVGAAINFTSAKDTVNQKEIGV